MAQRFLDPYPQFWSSSAAYSGGTITFFQSGTSTPLAVYSDKALVSSIGTSITLNSAGRIGSDVFLANQDYKCVLKDSDGVTIWTADPVRGSDYTDIPLWSVGSGSPNGVVAGTAASSGVMPTVYYDYTNAILYICTTTGTASTAVWTALNASAATPSVPPPQGRLTPTSATPVISSDVISGTAVYYSPYVGSLVPIYNGSSMIPTTFSELTLTLAAQHALNTIYDVFVFSNSGVLTLVTGPAWTTSTAGSGARGSGASTTQLARVSGIYTNAVSITGRNGATTYTIGANLATFVGSISIDGTAGQVTCHVTVGQTRKWAVSNAYNRVPIVLRCIDSTASWTYTSATIRQSRATAGNTLAVFSCLPEESIETRFKQRIMVLTGGADNIAIYIGVNSTTVASGTRGNVNSTANSNVSATVEASFTAQPFIGINNINSLENSTANGTNTFFGTETDMLLSAKWNG